MPAPHAKQKTRLPSGSGSSRSSSSTRAMSNGTGSRASGSATRNGTTLCRALSTLSTMSMPRTISTQPSPAATPAMSPARGRPRDRPSITARWARVSMA
jgi:hypothetical protein